MTIMERVEAIQSLAVNDLNKLSFEEREEILTDWWGIDSDDDEFWILPEQLRLELAENDEPLFSAIDVRYNPLLIAAIAHGYQCVSNEYISNRMYQITGQHFEIQGEFEPLNSCPCCNYQTLKLRGEYLVCPVCYWEDDGCNEVDAFSHVNRMTLREARENFKAFGAVLEKYIPFIENDVKIKYSLKQDVN